MTPQFIVLGPEGVDEASRGSHSSTTPLSVSTSLSPSKNLTAEPTVQSDSMRRLYQYFFVNSPRVSAAHNFSGGGDVRHVHKLRFSHVDPPEVFFQSRSRPACSGSIPSSQLTTGSGSCTPSGSSRRHARERNMSSHTRATTVGSHPPRFSMPLASERLRRSP